MKGTRAQESPARHDPASPGIVADQIKDKRPPRELPWFVIALLRFLSMLIGYGLWILSRWLREIAPATGAPGLVLLGVTMAFAVAFLILGALAPEKLLLTVWRVLGTIVKYLILVGF